MDRLSLNHFKNIIIFNLWRKYNITQYRNASSASSVGTLRFIVRYSLSVQRTRTQFKL